VVSRARRTLLVLFAGAVALGCSGGDDDASTAPAGDGEAATPARFCDEYLDYLAEPSRENLDAVVAAGDDPQVDELGAIIAEDDRTGRVLAADRDLTDLARDRCTSEWVGAAQGGGDTAGAAQAFLDALLAGDEVGARNVAAANVIAAFEPWEPLVPDAEAGTPALLTTGDRTFTLAIDAARLAECQVEGGVVIACTVVG